MDKIQLEILQLAEGFSNNNSFSVILGEKNGNRKMVVVIGFSEAQAIALSLDNIKPSRPVTHDLMYNINTLFNIEMLEMIITDIKAGVYHSTIVCKKGDFIVDIDSRTSDALALAVRYQCPIYVKKDIFEKVFTVFEEQTKQTIDEFEEELEEELKEMNDISLEELEKDTVNPYTDNTIGELEEMLKDAISNEDYELAARLRDEIDKRK
ncbi:MAG: bifunctional nuclease domain-containing protein [Chitinophagales bacterium]